MARRLPENPDARIDEGQLALRAPDRFEVPADTAHAHDALSGLLPLVDLAELLMEVDGWVGFSDPLLRFSTRREPTPRDAAATRPALFAVLVAEATNLGLATMARASGIPYGQLLRVHESCFGEDALREAIAALVYHRSLPLTPSFGPGTTSSSDGMRFGTSASGLHARHLPRYFGMRRGVSVYSHVSDKAASSGSGSSTVSSGRPPLSSTGSSTRTHCPPASTTPTPMATPTCSSGSSSCWVSVSPLAFGTFPTRPCTGRGAGRTTGRSTARFGARSETTSSSSTGTISTAWRRRSPMGSCRRRCSSPSSRACRRQNSLQHAIQELGRMAKTRHLLAYVDDPALRRRVWLA